MTASVTTAQSAYRSLLRATRIAFQNDTRLLFSAREQARQTFQESRFLVAGSEEAASRIRHAEEVALVLRRNVVQGVLKDEDGIGGGSGRREGGGGQGKGIGGGRWELNIHDEIERGNNETIKSAGRGTPGEGQGGCCSA